MRREYDEELKIWEKQSTRNKTSPAKIYQLIQALQTMKITGESFSKAINDVLKLNTESNVLKEKKILSPLMRPGSSVGKK